MIYRGIIHAHSTYSYDGKLSLVLLKKLLQAKGLSFACMTEHTDYLNPERAAAFVAECRTLSDASFVFVPGFEVPYQNAHVLHIGSTSFKTNVARTAAELHMWHDSAALVVLAHPVRNHFTVDGVLLALLDGIEIWNQQYEGKRVPRLRSLRLLEQLRLQKPLRAFGGIDLHRAEHLGSPYTTINVPVLSEATILAALQQGTYTFGHDTLYIGAFVSCELSVRQRLRSRYAIAVIAIGKWVNATLARLGIRLPKRLVRSIRARV